jgi:thioredoxin reductase/bacterioferritin-associated ferredoxin
VRSAECVIVGAGSAGLAAARTAARHGVRVVLIDERRELGGQGGDWVPSTARATAGGDRFGDAEEDKGHRLVEAVRTLGVGLRLGAVAWAVFDPRVVALATDSEAECIAADTLILATGAFDRPVPFPGWTLPGVMTAGAALRLMTADRVLPGRRVLIAGSGPLLLALAHQALRGGAEVAAVCEASPMRGAWRQAHRLVPHLDYVQQAHHYRRVIRDAGVPVLAGHVLRRALGESAVTGAVVSPCDGDWRPIGGAERHLDVDAVIAGYGFVSSTELARLAGCEHRYAPEVGDYVLVKTREMESTVPGLFIAGGGAGAAGSVVALEEGHVAGLAVAHRLGRIDARAYSREASRARGRLLHLAGLREVIDVMHRFGPGVYALAEDATLLCRCEEISTGEARAAIRDGATHVNEIKARTRIGMGRCQGRLCGPALAHAIAGASAIGVVEAGAFTPRPPVKPVSLGALANPVG